jgi:hypothetical protein
VTDFIEGYPPFTPTLTFATPGDLAVTYATRVGDCTIQGREVHGSFRIVTSAFTFTTASGSLNITGFPITPSNDSGFVWDGACTWGGITKAGYTNIVCTLAAGSSIILLTASGPAVAPVTITAADMPTGGNVVLRGNFRFRI